MPNSAAIESSSIDADYFPVLRLWILRALVHCNGLPGLLHERRFGNMTVARLLGYTDADFSKYTEAWAVRSVQRKFRAVEQRPPALPTNTVLARNLQCLADRLDLTHVERDILHFTILHRVCGEFGEALDMLGELRGPSVWRLFSECLGHPLAAVQLALDERGKLSRSALLSLDPMRPYPFASKIDLLPGLADSVVRNTRTCCRCSA